MFSSTSFKVYEMLKEPENIKVYVNRFYNTYVHMGTINNSQILIVVKVLS